MKSGHTTGSWQTGKQLFAHCRHHTCMLTLHSLLNQPFDFSQAFDRALKNIIKTLPNRPAHESADDTVGTHHISIRATLISTGLLLRLRWQLWRVRLQPTYTKLPSPQPHGLIGRYRNEVFARTTQGRQKCTLQREQAFFPLQGIPRPDDDHEWSGKHECIPNGRRRG